MKKKILVACLCVALAVLTIAGTTLAYLTSQDTVTNTFTVGNVSITLDEAKVNPDGTLVYKEDGQTLADRVDSNTYKLIPGHTYTKDPTVHVDANSENSWIFVKVENGISVFEAVTVAGGYTAIAGQITANGWTALVGVENVYYKEYTTKTVQDNLAVFQNFQIADEANSNSNWENFNGTVTVTAYAVQKDGFNTASNAWAATFGKTTT